MLGWERANTTEVDPATAHPVIIDMPEISQTQLGGTMRLGLRTTTFVKPSVASTCLPTLVFFMSFVVRCLLSVPRVLTAAWPGHGREAVWRLCDGGRTPPPSLRGTVTLLRLSPIHPGSTS